MVKYLYGPSGDENSMGMKRLGAKRSGGNRTKGVTVRGEKTCYMKARKLVTHDQYIYPRKMVMS